MRQRNSYSRIIQDLKDWKNIPKGTQIHLLQHSVERDFTSFFAEGFHEHILETSLGTALSESGLSRDEIQLIGCIRNEDLKDAKLESLVENCLLNLRTDYLDLLLLEFSDSRDLTSDIERLHSVGKIMEVGNFRPNLNLPAEPVTNSEITAVMGEFIITPASLKTLTNREAHPGNVTEILKIAFSENGLDPDLLSEMSTKYGLSEKQLAICWLVNHPQQYHLILNSDSPEAIDQASKTLHVKMIEEDWKKFTEKI